MDVTAAATAIADAHALVIGAGAGMGVDSGLPDFRGNEGFWEAYPPFRHLGLGFVDLANPGWFEDDPALAWGFYGHRLNLYRQTVPHLGFELLQQWSSRMQHGSFVFTSNVDGQFQKAGFADERVLECHGSIHHFQALSGRDQQIFEGHDAEVVVDETTMRATEPFPHTPAGEPARPNILMFGDWGWRSQRAEQQQRRFQQWLADVSEASGDASKLVVVECGAGSAVPTVRHQSEDLVRRLGARLVRINPREPDVPAGQIALPLGALEALAAIDEALQAW